MQRQRPSSAEENKVNMRRWIALTLAAILMLGQAGCAGRADFSEQEETVQMEKELTARQISILEELGLPTDYEQLNITQQSAIHAIEMLLSKLEEKYGEEFAYLGYVAGGVEREHLIAYPVSGSRTDRVTLYRWAENGTVRYEDNYHTVKAMPFFREAAASLAAEYVRPADTKLYCKIYDAKGTITAENAAENVSATVYLFLNSDGVSEASCLALGEAYGQWLQANCNGMSSSVLLMRTDPDSYWAVTEENYDSMLWKDIFSIRKEYIVDTSGELRTLE